ncbi:Beauvericin cluster-specific repressor BEA4 [Pseudocercospora fuligena]|uniref:Beauvericin cluster-specific repressor BEA4 n=1 Tax=Pseudocercospora fuligena TaxID=685502 RepID=A0A8H6VHG5_9PEZI|nr:Beauvericin cluster-specific repressor BEA4 [Pseudocercospora fuligena]
MTATTAPPPRKRRRRTAASGAQDDCFSCRKRAVPCDRKRPYCTQCIEIGKECSGYKTTLTWGVGVASRGKLRGLSCPIAGKSVEVGVSSQQQDEPRRRKSSATKAKHEDTFEGQQISNGSPFTAPTSAPTSISTTHTSFQQPLPTINQGQHGWQIPRVSEHHQVRPDPLRHHSLQHIHTALGPQYDGHGMPRSGSSLGSFAEQEYHSPAEYPVTPESAFNDPYIQAHTGSYTSQPLSSSVDSLTSNVHGSSIGSYGDHMSSSIDPVQSNGLFGSSGCATTVDYHPTTYHQDEVLFSPLADMSTINPFDDLEGHFPQDEDEDQKTLQLLDPRFSTPFFHITPRLQSLMEYYDRHVCTYLVAFDGSENPYRKHVLQLAMHNEGLQNAIAALATNNMRMRRQPPPRQMGFVEEITDAFDGSHRPKDLNEPTAEELCYKQMSIDQLNMQLTDSRAAQDDSVLATLLILCLFHVCDSGFSKFKTQLAGVQKLLSLRDRQTQSDFTGWVEMFFLWFDVLTSAVNDREMQIKSESLDMLDYGSGLGALEQFSGCDGRLFKLIARLGRLNLLAQGRAVRPGGSVDRMPRPPSTHKAHRPSFKKRKLSAKTLHIIDYERIDGNGWGTPIISSDEEDNESSDRLHELHRSTSDPDSRQEFWSEWNDIRARLQAWTMDTYSVPPPTESTTAQEFELGQRDMLHINESFRYSALLYTERLGSPLLPSSHPNFQQYVSAGLQHITALEITSCVNKFLLWPLFIIGTECVDEQHRNVIRERCIEVQKESGFWNNISGLEVLEKVWREVGNNVQGMEAAEIKARRRDSEAGRTGWHGQAFRWRKAMDRIDGEYIVI